MQGVMIQPGDKVILVVPAQHIVAMNASLEQFAAAFDDAYEGVDFEIFPSDEAKEPKVLFIYRDPEAYVKMRREAEILSASEKAGVTPEVIHKVRAIPPMW